MTTTTFSPEALDAISVADAMMHPDFSAALRQLLHQIDTNASDLTLGQMAALLGLDALTVARQLANSLIMAEVGRIIELHAARQRGLN